MQQRIAAMPNRKEMHFLTAACALHCQHGKQLKDSMNAVMISSEKISATEKTPALAQLMQQRRQDPALGHIP